MGRRMEWKSNITLGISLVNVPKPTSCKEGEGKKVGKVSGSEKIKICLKIVTFKRFQRKIVTSKQILFVLDINPLP